MIEVKAYRSNERRRRISDAPRRTSPALVSVLKGDSKVKCKMQIREVNSPTTKKTKHPQEDITGDTGHDKVRECRMRII